MKTMTRIVAGAGLLMAFAMPASAEHKIHDRVEVRIGPVLAHYKDHGHHGYHQKRHGYYKPYKHNKHYKHPRRYRGHDAWHWRPFAFWHHDRHHDKHRRHERRHDRHADRHHRDRDRGRRHDRRN